MSASGETETDAKVFMRTCVCRQAVSRLSSRILAQGTGAEVGYWRLTELGAGLWRLIAPGRLARRVTRTSATKKWLDTNLTEPHSE